MKASYFCASSALAVAMTLGLGQTAEAAAAAPAAPAPAAPEVSEVVVTGSYIAGTPTTAALPVNVIGAEDLKKQGSPTTVNLVKTITAAQSSIGESNRFLGTAAGAATINLRGFGSSRTLVLFNGRRMANSPAAVAAESTDINFIPQAAIGRIEILRDGAAATYGSDAVGGVVNFITRKDLDGFEVQGNYTHIRGSDGDYDASVSWGKKFDRGNALVTATYRRRSELRTTDRDWALQPFAKNFFGGWSTAGNPGVFTTGTAAQLATGTFSQSFLDNGCTNFGGVLANAASPASGCRFQFTQFDNLVNDEYHYQLYGELNFEVTDDIRTHFEVLWSKHDVPRERVSPAQSTTQFPTPIVASGGSPGGGTSPYPAVGLNQQSRFYVPASNPGLIAFLANPANCPALGSICTNAAANGVIASQTLWRPEGYGGNPLFPEAAGADLQRREADAFRIAGDVTGHVFNGIGWDFGVTFQENTGRVETPDISVTRLELALRGLGGPGCNPVTGTPGAGACSYFNPFANAYTGNPSTGGTNPFAAANASNNNPLLLNWIHQYLNADVTTQLATADLVFNGKTGITLPGGEIAWALGGQWRYDRYKVDADPNYDIAATPCVDSPPYGDGLPVCTGGTGAFTFYPAIQRFDIDRVVRAAFGEVKLPVTDTFELTGAVRYEYYGGNFGSTTNPKVSARWQALDWLAIRGSAGSTFRAPPQTSLTPGSNRGLAQFNLPADSPTTPAVGNLYRPVDTANNPNLQAETADTYNVGLIVQAGPFRATLDYFKFKFKNELTTETAASVVTTMFPSSNPATWQCGNAAFASRFTFADDGNPATNDCKPSNLLAVKTNLINGPSVDTSGLDFAGTYFLPDLVFGGDLTIGGDATYTIEYKRGALMTLDGITIAPAIDRAGKSELLSAFYSYPKTRANLYFNWNRGPHNLRWTTHYKQGTTNIIAGQPDLKTDDEITSDLVYTGNLAWDTQVTVGINNIFDKDPPFTRSQYNYDYTNAFFLGRTITLGVRKHF
ncbi:MAG: TonB-dependent receptor domain-containing protein [Phenylobacterium sp.]